MPTSSIRSYAQWTVVNSNQSICECHRCSMWVCRFSFSNKFMSLLKYETHVNSLLKRRYQNYTKILPYRPVQKSVIVFIIFDVGYGGKGERTEAHFLFGFVVLNRNFIPPVLSSSSAQTSGVSYTCNMNTPMTIIDQSVIQ